VAAPAAGAGTEIDARVDSKPVSHEIHGHGFGFLVEFLVDDELKAVHVENVVGISRLIQSHGQRRTASAALVQKDANGRNLLVLEIFGYLIMSRRGDLNHLFLLFMTHAFAMHAWVISEIV
jgi:hypothetical protein